MGRLYSAKLATQFGGVQIISSDTGLVYVQLPRSNGRGFAGWQRKHAADDSLCEAAEPNRAALSQLREYFQGKRARFNLPLDLRATEFQLRVYDALLQIPYGETRAYIEVARAIGAPQAQRAVGAANGANPVSLVVPCHRVVASGGKLGGYGGGLPLKKKLLALEARNSALL